VDDKDKLVTFTIFVKGPDRRDRDAEPWKELTFTQRPVSSIKMQFAPATEVSACESKLQCDVGSSESLLKDKLKINRVSGPAFCFPSVKMLE
jgi:hypothetical protein